MSDERLREDVAFRSLAAPGLDEDDLFVAIQGLPAPGPYWGEGRPWARRDEERPWCEEAERHRRHEELMRKWARVPGTAGGPAGPSRPVGPRR
jgi:hypothetical protein